MPGQRPPAAGARRIVKASDVELQVRREEPPVPAVDVEALVAEAAQAAAADAYRAGYEDGFGAGALQAGATLADAVEQLTGTVAVELAKLQAAVAVRREDEAARLVDLAFVVAEWAARRELSSVPDAFFGRLEELLADRERRAPVEIAVHPDLLRATRAWAPDPELRIIATEELEPGECRVTVGDGTVFATFSDAFARARAALGELPPLEVSALGARAPMAAGGGSDEELVEELPLADLAGYGRGPAAGASGADARLGGFAHAPVHRVVGSGDSDGFDLSDGLDDEVVEVLYDADQPEGGAW